MSNTNTNLQTQTSNALHNAIMEVGGKNCPPMLAPGNYVQWKSQIKRYIDTKPNNEHIHYCLQNLPYKFKWTEKTVPVAEGSPETTIEGYMKNYKNVSQDIRNQLDAKAKAVQIILTWIHNDIYSTVDACPNASATRNKGKATVNSSLHTYDQEPAMVAEDDEIANQDITLRINKGIGYNNQRVVNVDGARENIEQADWRDETDDEPNDQELKVHYLYIEKIQEVTPNAADNSGPIFDTQPLQKVFFTVKSLQGNNRRTRVIVKTIHVNFDELSHMASDHFSSDPVPQRPTMAFEQGHLSPGPKSQENVPQSAETVTTSNELDLLCSLMFDELFNGTTQVVSKSSTLTVADAPNQPEITTNDAGTSTTIIPCLVTIEEKAKKKNDVKARSMLLMALPNEHLMTFNQYKDAKTLFAAIETRFGGNEATKKTQKTLLKQFSNSFSEVPTLFGVSTASPKVNTANLSDATVYAFLANQPNGSQLVHEDLEQIHEDDLEEMDLKWQLALLNSKIVVLKSKLEKISNENNALDVKIRKFKNASQSMDKLIASQITDNSKSGLGYVSYNAVSPPHTGRFSPPRINLSHTGLPEFAEPRVKIYRVTPIKVVDQTSSVKISAPIKENFSAPLIEDWESDEEDEVESPPEKERKNVEPSVNKVEVEIPKQNDKPARRPVKYAEMYRTQRPRGNQRNWNNLNSHQLGSNFVMYNKACYVYGSFNHLQARCKYHQRERMIEDQGYFDSECSRHMTRNISYLTDFKKFDGGYVAFGGGAKGGKITGKADESYVLPKVSRKNNMYSVDMKNIVPKKDLTCLVVKATNDESMLWHRRLGHINFKNINKLVKGNLVRGLPLKHFENDQTCVACLKGKQHKVSFKSKIQNSITQPLFMLHMDLFGPTSVSSIMHKKLCLVITDDFSRFTYVFFLATKDETSRILKRFITEIENLVDKKVKIIRCNNGTEFKNRVMNEFCVEKGIKREYSVARTPQQNRVAERRNTTLIEEARTMLADSKLPITFWAEAVSTAYHLGKFDGKSDEGDGPKWLFDIDALTESINYVPVSVDSDGENLDTDGLSIKRKIDNQERPNDENSTKDINIVGPSINTASLNINTASLTVNTVRLSDDYFGANNDMRSLDEIELDRRNLFTTYPVPTTPDTRINKDHSLDNMIGDMQSGVQIRRMTVTTEPKRITNALKDPAWVEAMQEDLLQFHLQKNALYSLHQAPRAWYETLAKYLLDNGFRRGKIDQTMFIKRQKEDILLVKMYVYDIIFGSTKKELCTEFEDKYVDEILRKFKYEDVKPANTPMDKEKALLKDCSLPITKIFEQLALMGPKKTSWEQFSSNITIARTVLPQTKDTRLNTSHKRLYIALVLTQKDFSNIKRESKGFSGVETSLFPTMLVTKHVSHGEGPTSLVGTQCIPTIIESSPHLQNISITYRKTRTKTGRMGIRIPQSNVLSSAADEAITKEMHDVLGRSTTTASSLAAEQGSGNISKTQTKATPSGPSSPRTTSEGGPGCHFTMRGSHVHTRPERLSNLPNEPPLGEGNRSQNGEGSMQYLELMEICTKLPKKVTSLENELTSGKAIYNKALITLTKRGRMIAEINKDENVNLVKSSKQGEAHKGKGIMQEPELPKKIKKRERIQLRLDEELDQKLYAEELAKETARQEQEKYNLEKALELQKQLDERKEDKGDQAHYIDWSDPSVLRYHALQNRPFFKDEEDEMKKYLKIVPDEEIAIDATPLATKPPVIVDWKIISKGMIKVGISHKTYVARSPQQNGVVERRNRTLIEAARTMLIYAQAPLFLWGEAVATACFTQNRSIIRLRHGKTPYELMHGKQPDLSYFHVFGALCYPTNDGENVGKLQPKADIGIFMGYAPTKKAFGIYNRRTRRIVCWE
nr:hypothetical protein [Tanacetum cinerariifolium]